MIDDLGLASRGDYRFCDRVGLARRWLGMRRHAAKQAETGGKQGDVMDGTFHSTTRSRAIDEGESSYSKKGSSETKKPDAQRGQKRLVTPEAASSEFVLPLKVLNPRSQSRLDSSVRYGCGQDSDSWIRPERQRPTPGNLQ